MSVGGIFAYEHMLLSIRGTYACQSMRAPRWYCSMGRRMSYWACRTCAQRAPACAAAVHTSCAHQLCTAVPACAVASMCSLSLLDTTTLMALLKSVSG